MSEGESRLHHVEACYDGPTRSFGWQCFDADCKAERMGFASLPEAEAAGSEHGILYEGETPK